MKKLKVIVLTLMVTSFFHGFSQEIGQNKGLEVGEKITDFAAVSTNGDFKLSEELKKNTVILIFYRGHWCPVCNRYLTALQDSLYLLEEKGAKVFAVTPEKLEYISETKVKTKAQFELLYDEKYFISEQFKVLFEPTNKEKTMYNMIGANLDENYTDTSERLPVPATFIIDKNSTIVWKHFNEDYKKRASVKQMLQNLPN